MNEKIKAVAREAGLFVEDQYPGGFPNEGVLVTEEFAKMIIREFAYDCMDATGKPEMVEFAAKYWGVEL